MIQSIESVDFDKLTPIQRMAVVLSKRVGGVTPDGLEIEFYGHVKYNEPIKKRLGRISACHRCLNTLVKKHVLKKRFVSYKPFTGFDAAKLIRNRRRYYIHQKVKHLFPYSAHRRQIEITEDDLKTITPRQRKYLDELQHSFGYNIQYTIPQPSQTHN